MSSLSYLVDRVRELSKALAAKAEIPEVSFSEVGWDFIYGVVSRKLPRPEYVHIMDGRYRVTTLDGYRSIIEWDKTNLRRYIMEFWDCDDYAFRFKSNVSSVFLINGVGVAVDLSEERCAHAYNLLFTSDGNVYVYEPQVDRIMTVDEARKMCQYQMRWYYIIV